MAGKGDRLAVVLDARELGAPRQVGTLIRWPGTGERRPVSFEYDEAWLGDREAFELDPRTRLFAHDQPLGLDALPPALLDTTPDAWGKMLIQREHRRLLGNWEMLVDISDETRMGALRLGPTAAGPFVRAGGQAVPPIASLRELQDLARQLEEDPDAEINDRRLRDLVAPGSSLGGARPKANVRDADGSLWIAKFPSGEDRRIDLGAWEFVYAELAREAGIDVADHRIEAVMGRGRGRTYLVRRFDRNANGSRRLFVSGMTLTDHRDGEPASYPDLAKAIADQGAAGAVKADLAQLFRRLLFNVVAGNRDDHLRNHGFLRTREGWRLAPAFDMNPSRAAHRHSLSLDGRSDDQDVRTAFATHRLYQLSERDAREILGGLVRTVSRWEATAKAAAIGRIEREAVAPAFAQLKEAGALAAA
ncbi:MAG TPA: HipA domain-containing protein [Candidatus Saccharimonadales bacterium]|nr:HipA domain-containing protein [Candidatus Saccharimonadales bacterium]